MKFLQLQLKLWRAKACLYFYNRYFSKFIYSFETTETTISKLNEVERREYLRSVSEWVQTPAYKIEYQGELEELYRELACNAQTEDLLTAYRLLILRVKNKDLRLRGKVNEFNAQQAFHTIQSKLK